jgi:hypothetical protein
MAPGLVCRPPDQIPPSISRKTFWSGQAKSILHLRTGWKRNSATGAGIPAWANAARKRRSWTGVMVLVGRFAFRPHCTLGIVPYKARIGSPPVLGRSIRGSFWRAVAVAQICIRARDPGTPGNLGSA